MTNTSLNSSVGRASVYQTEGPEFNPRLGRKSFESFLNFYLINDVSAVGKSRFSYIMGITSSAIMKLPKIHFHTKEWKAFFFKSRNGKLHVTKCICTIQQNTSKKVFASVVDNLEGLCSERFLFSPTAKKLTWKH